MSEENYSKRSCPAVPKRDDDEPREYGEFNFYVKDVPGYGEHVAGMMVVCPGCKWPVAAPFRKPSLWPKQPHDWHWDGNREKPTLTPSLHHVGCWHGHLRNGVFTSC